MEYRIIDNTCVIRLDVGDEIFESLTHVCKKENIRSAIVNGIGAVDDVTVGYYSTLEGRYFPKTYNQQFEMISLNGNITVKDEEPYLHLHIALSDENYNLRGGHLNRAVVSVTAEIFLSFVNDDIKRRVNPYTNLNIFDI